MRRHKNPTFTRSLMRERRAKGMWNLDGDSLRLLFFSLFYIYSSLFLIITIVGISRHTCWLYYNHNRRDMRCGFITIKELRSLSRITSISLSRQFPHSRQVFSFTSVHGKRVPSVVVSYRIYRRVEVFFAAESAYRIFFEGFS